MLDRKGLNEKFSQHSEKFLFTILCLGLLWTVFTFFRSESTAPPDSHLDDNEMPFEADRMIPEGYVLIPLEFENQTALSSLIGDYGVINVYTSAGLEGKRGRLIAKNVKILRAPNNPQAFAVLVPDQNAVLFMNVSSGFYGVVQRKDTSVHFSQTEKPAKTKILIEEFEETRGAQ